MMNYWITVVDDDAMCMANTKSILTERNMRVSCLRSGVNFMRFIKSNTPDLVLLDIMMPGTDGFQTYHDLRKFEKEAGRDPVPVIFLSGENPTEAVPYGLKIGAADYVSKPCDPVVLMSRIERAIENSRMIKGLIKDSEHDKLTGFLNKASGTRRIAELCGTKAGVLLVIDLDSFKLVNDLYGHETGDRVLVLFADTMRKNIRSEEVICRVGGDEFMAFLANVSEEEKAAAVIRRVSEMFVTEAKLLMGNDCDIPLGISVGAAMTPLHSTSFETLFRYADQTMYKVRKNGKHGFAVYDPDPGETAGGTEIDRELERLSQICGERGGTEGAMLLGQDAFIAGYRFAMRFIRYCHGSASQIVFSLCARNGAEGMTEAPKAFGEVLQKELRICDIVMRSRPDQFFVLMPGISEQDAEKYLNRIMTAREEIELRGGISIDHYIKTVSFKTD